MILDTIRANARSTTAPLEPAKSEDAFWGSRSDAGRSLPPYYLVYFLLVNLLDFEDLGRVDKVAFSIPVNIDGTVLMVEHRKFGLGIFIKDPADEAAAEAASRCIHAGVKAAEPYFEALANDAAKGSDLNVENNSQELFERFSFFRQAYVGKLRLAEEKKGERIERNTSKGEGVSQSITITRPSYQLLKESRWYATAAIEAFYSWTEHVFILVAILQGKVATGEDVAKTAGAEWKEKFKLALDINDPVTKRFYDRLMSLRTQVRNFVAHGAFGKNGQALSFHSIVGAVPMLLPHKKNKEQFRFGNGVDLLPPEAMQLVSDFADYMWSGKLSPAKIYLDSGLPLILSYASNGLYARAMISDDEMNDFTHYLGARFDNAANMDW